jgi:hypothetical protein
MKRFVVPSRTRSPVLQPNHRLPSGGIDGSEPGTKNLVGVGASNLLSRRMVLVACVLAAARSVAGCAELINTDNDLFLS